MAKNKKAKGRAKLPVWKPQPDAAAFFAGDFPALISATGTAKARAKAIGDAIGVELAPDLAAFVEKADHAESFGEWRIDPHPSTFEHGFAEIVAIDQADDLGTALVECFTASVNVGTAGNGDTYLAHPMVDGQQQAPVWLFDHETSSFAQPVADSVMTLAFLNKQYVDVHRDDVATAEIGKRMAKIADRIQPSWHYNHVVEVSGVTPSYDLPAHPRFYFYRALWILTLLRNDLAAVPASFAAFDQRTPDLDDALDNGFVGTYLVSGLYWLWRTWFLGHDKELDKVLAVTTKSKSPLLRDAAKLITELRGGRNQLGAIADIQQLRRDFQALDLDPKRDKAREKERGEKAKADVAVAKAETAAAKKLIAGGGDLVELAWQHLDRPHVVRAIYEHLRDDASFATDFARYEFLTEGKSSRGGSSYDQEPPQVAEALGATGRLLPLCLVDPGKYGLAAIAHSPDLARALPHLIAMLGIREEYNRTLTGVVTALVNAHAKDAGPVLVRFLSQFDAADEYRNKEILIATMAAVAGLREPKALPALMKLATHKDFAPKALKALGELGDRRATSFLVTALAGAHGDVAAYALSRLADPAAWQAVEDHVTRKIGHPTQTIYLRTMLAAFAAAIGKPVALPVLALDVIMDHTFAAEELHLTAVELVGKVASREDAIRLLTPFIDTEYASVRRAVWKTLGVTPVYYDRAHVDELFERGGAEALVAALNDPNGVFKVNLLRKAADAKVGKAVGEAAAPVAKQLTRFNWYTNPGYKRDGWDSIEDTVSATVALKADATDDLIETEWLDHPNTLVREALDDVIASGSKRIAKLEDSPRRETPRAVPVPGAAPPLAVQKLAFGHAPFRFATSINGLAFSPDGQRIVAVGPGRGGIFDNLGNEMLVIEDVNGHAYDVAWHPDGGSVVVCFHAGHVRRYNATTGELIQRYKGHSGVPNGVRRVTFNADGSKLASVGDDETFMIWNTESGKALGTYEDKLDINCVAFLDAKTIAIGTDKAVHLLDHKGKHVAKSELGGLAGIAAIDDKTFAVGGSTKNSIAIIDRKLKKKAALKQNNVARLALSADRTKLIAASWEGDDCGVSMWDIAKEKRKRLEGHDDSSVWAMVVDPNSGTIAAGGQKGLVVRWSADGTLLGKRGINHNGEVGGIAVVADRVYTCANNLIEWNLATGEALREFARGKKQGYSLNDIAVTGTMLYATGMAGCAAWELSSGEQRWHTKLERSERVILDGDKLMLGSGDELTWLDAATGAIVGKAFDTGNVLYQLIPLTNDRVAISDFLGGHEMQIWTRGGKRLPDLALTIEGTHGIYSAAASRDGTTLYISCADETIKVYDTSSWQLQREYHGEYTSDRVAVSPSQTVVAGSTGKTVELFDAMTFEKRGDISVGDGVERLVFVDDHRLLCGLEGGGVTCVFW